MDKIKNVAQRLGIITVEDMERYTALELIMMIANKLKECQETVNDHSDKIQYLLDEGLLLEVVQIFDEWMQDGTFDTLINQSALKEVNKRIDETNTQLSEIQYRATNDNFQKIILDVPEYSTISLEDSVDIEKLTMKNNIKIIGKGELNFIGDNDILINLSNLKNIIFSGLTINVNCGNINTFDSGLFYLHNSDNILFENCTIISNNRSVFSFSSSPSSHITIKNNKISTNGNYSFTIFTHQRQDQDVIKSKGNEMVVDGNYFYDTTTCILLDCDNSKIINNTFKKVSAPIGCSKVKNTIFNNNIFKGFTSNALCLGNGGNDLIENVVVSNNIIDGLDDDGNKTSVVHGINVYKQGGDSDSESLNHPNIGKSKFITITGNNITNCNNAGIFAYGNGNMTISSNSCSRNSWGIMVGGGGGTAKIHPGLVTVSANYCSYNSGGINIGSSSIKVNNIIVSDNVCSNNEQKGIYLAKVDNGVIANNLIYKNGGTGLFLNSVTNSKIEGNSIKDNLTVSDAEGFNGQVTFSLTSNNGVKFINNDLSAVNPLYYNTKFNPFILKNNVNVTNVEGMFMNECYQSIVKSKSTTINVKLPSSSSWASGCLMIQVSGDRTGGNNPDQHHSAIAILNVMKFESTISVGDVTYLYKTTNTNDLTINATTNADNSSLDITVDTNYQDTNHLIVTIQPLKSLLFLNNF